MSDDWLEDYWHELKGKYKHHCAEFDSLPVEETCLEWLYCTCYAGDVMPDFKNEEERINLYKGEEL
jgi:hypothetical protein